MCKILSSLFAGAFIFVSVIVGGAYSSIKVSPLSDAKQIHLTNVTYTNANKDTDKANNIKYTITGHPTNSNDENYVNAYGVKILPKIKNHTTTLYDSSTMTIKPWILSQNRPAYFSNQSDYQKFIKNANAPKTGYNIICTTIVVLIITFGALLDYAAKSKRTNIIREVN